MQPEEITSLSDTEQDFELVVEQTPQYEDERYEDESSTPWWITITRTIA